MTYTLCQWALLFFFYSLCGWIWESAFVSIRQRQWVNRGFLHGPILPIYGFGALLILLATLAFQDKVGLVYALGMAAATALEYLSGAAMEAIFHVRYGHRVPCRIGIIVQGNNEESRIRRDRAGECAALGHTAVANESRMESGIASNIQRSGD